MLQKTCRFFLHTLLIDLILLYNGVIIGYRLEIHLCFLLLDLRIINVVIVSHQLIDSSFRREFDDTVGNGVDELMVVGREDDIALELYQVVVERLNGFKVKVVRWRVEDQAVSASTTRARVSISSTARR